MNFHHFNTNSIPILFFLTTNIIYRFFLTKGKKYTFPVHNDVISTKKNSLLQYKIYLRNNYDNGNKFWLWFFFFVCPLTTTTTIINNSNFHLVTRLISLDRSIEKKHLHLAHTISTKHHQQSKQAKIIEPNINPLSSLRDN